MPCLRRRSVARLSPHTNVTNDTTMSLAYIGHTLQGNSLSLMTSMTNLTRGYIETT